MDVNSPDIILLEQDLKLIPIFYIGSEEIFMKKWSDIYINLNWKDKPADFTDYYNGYQDYLDQYRIPSPI